MRSPAANFDIRAALGAEIKAANAALVTAAHDPHALHQCRVRLKRARALARVSAVCAPGLTSVFLGAARDAMRALSKARDLAALAQAAERLSLQHRGAAKTALGAVAAALERERAAAPAPDTAAARASLRDLGALIQVWPDVSERQIDKGARLVKRRALRAYRQGYAARDPEHRHTWRKREKDRLYAVEILGAAWPKACKRRRKSSARLSEVLGRERDVLLLRARLAADPGLAGDFNAAARAMRALEHRQAKLAKRANRLGARLHRNET